MPFIPHTPESLLERSDSKNPLSTCRGLTSNGRPCRRGISKSPHVSPSSSPRRASSPEAFCWQHKEQAAVHCAAPIGIQSKTIRERTSVDTLAERLGLLEVEQKKQERRRRKHEPVQEREKASERLEQRPLAEQHTRIEQRPQRNDKPRPRPKQQSNLVLLCCVGSSDDGKKPPRPVKKTFVGQTTASVPMSQQSQSHPLIQSKSHRPSNITLQPHPHRPFIHRDPSSRTGEFLSLIPSSALPQTTALLLAELAKPVSEFDDNGYIYMFWLTPESLPAAPPSETASSLLAPPSRPDPGRRRTSAVLTTFASTVSSKSNKKTILLKIGRAQNIQRRLNQWSRQCGYNLSLIRYYPYQSSTPSETDVNEVSRTLRKVQNVHKVERLIHIELSGMRVQGSGCCTSCGKEHREWFEVEASRDGVKAVDEVIRRWSDWGERDGA
jgi:hypothetical protein